MSGIQSRGFDGAARAMALKRGFTLIEVLVVVSIIALLIAILLPSLARAKEMGSRAGCLSNLHQQGVAMTIYAQDHKTRLPIRGSFGYNISEHKYLHIPGMRKNDPGAKEKDPVNFGALYGKWIGKDLRFFYCTSIPKRFYDDPTYGMSAFLRHNDDTSYVTWGGYMYAAPVEVGKCPRVEGKQIYPSDIWHEYFINRWVIPEKGYNSSNYTDYQKMMPSMQALVSDGVIGGVAGLTAIQASHKDGLNVLFSDFHASYVNDPTGELRRLNPSSGTGGAPALYKLWETLGKRH